MNLIKDKIPVLGLDIVERRSSLFTILLPGSFQHPGLQTEPPEGNFPTKGSG